MHNLRSKFDKILLIVKQSLENVLDETGNIPKRGKKPNFSDAEVITLSLLSECLMYDSENYLFAMLHKHYKSQFTHLIERSRYNRRRRALAHCKVKFHKYLVQHLAE